MAERDTIRIFLFLTFLIALIALLLAFAAFGRSSSGTTGPTGPAGIATTAPIVVGISNGGAIVNPSVAAGGVFVLPSNFTGTLTVDAVNGSGTVGALVIIDGSATVNSWQFTATNAITLFPRPNNQNGNATFNLSAGQSLSLYWRTNTQLDALLYKSNPQGST